MLAISEFTQRTPEILAELRRLVEIESPSGDKAAVDRLGEALRVRLEALGAELSVERAEQAGDCLVGRWNTNDARPGILALCHMDTVYPLGTLAQHPWREQAGLAFGPGALDMKGGIALLLAALDALQEAEQFPERPLTVLFTADEEVGSRTSRALIERLARQAGLVLCLEPGLPDGSLKTWRKGIGDYEVRAYGRAAHAGAAHAQGRNAIEELAYQVIAIQGLTDYARGTTLNVGQIQGGTATNVVPEMAWAEVDLRVMEPGEAERIEQALHALQPRLEGTRLEVSGALNRPPMRRDERMAAAFSRAQEIGARLGLSLTEGGTGGGSDANFVAPLGVPVLDGLGPAGDWAHNAGREQLQIASLAPRAALLAALLTEWD